MSFVTRFLMFIILLFVFTISLLNSGIPDKQNSNNTQRLAAGLIDYQKNTASNVQFVLMNNGIFGYDYRNSIGGVFWPRESVNQYIFASGLWFGAMKPSPGAGEIKKFCSIGYNPNTGQGWFAPGRIEDGTIADSSEKFRYRIYFSTDMNKINGVPLLTSDGPNWPIWASDESRVLAKDNYQGNYVNDATERNNIFLPNGPAFLSHEDIFCTYKDTDINYYDSIQSRKNAGYPLGLQFEQTIYSWSGDEYGDIIIIKYNVINKSKNELFNCWIAPLYDMDIAHRNNPRNGATNDRCDYFHEIDSLNLIIGWSNTDQMERGMGFGYVGFELLQSPAIKKCEGTVIAEIDGVPGKYCWQCTEWKIVNGKETCIDSIFFDMEDVDFLRNDKSKYNINEQIGLANFRNWPITMDPNTDDDRYNFISSKVLDGDNGPGDKRILMSVGSFNMKPGDSACVFVGIVFALPAVEAEASGSSEDMGLKNGKIAKNSLLDKVYRSRQVFDMGLKLSAGDDELPAFENDNQLVVYPNPSSDLIFFNIPKSCAGNSRFEISNVHGIQVMDCSIESRESVYKVDISGLPSGNYIVRLENGINNYFYARFCIFR